MRNSKRKILSLILAFFMCGCFSLHANAQTDLEKRAEQVIYLTNLQRISAGLPPYQTTPSLQKIAFQRSAELTSSFSHIRPNGEECWTIFDNTDIQWTSAGENIAYETLGTAENAVSVWMKSLITEGIFSAEIIIILASVLRLTAMGYIIGHNYFCMLILWKILIFRTGSPLMIPLLKILH